jgi:hypothetical protein
MSRIDTSKIGVAAAELMEHLEKRFAEDQTVELGEIVISAEVRWEEEGDKNIEVITGSTTDNRVHQTGILDWALDLVSDRGIDADEEV